MDRLTSLPQAPGDRLNSSQLAANFPESTWDKFSREIDLFGAGIKAIPEAARSAVVEHPLATLSKGAVAAALSAGLTYASNCRGPVRLGAQVIGVGLGVAALSDGGKHLRSAGEMAIDAWRSPINYQQYRGYMQTQFAPLAVDAAISMSGSALGGYAGRSLLGAPPETRLPAYTSAGDLPPGVHQSGWQEFSSRYGFTPRRQELMGNMETLLQELHKQGGERVYVGGSFVTTKPAPGDFDMTWRVSGPQLGELSKKAPILTDRMLQKETLGGQLMATYPNSPGDGIVGFLQKNRSGRPIGIVELDLSTLPSQNSFWFKQALNKISSRFKGG